MLVAVVSDTHRSKEYIKKVNEVIQDADVLIHLGDNSDDIEAVSSGFKGEVYGVRGNCDLIRRYPDEQIIEIAGKRIFFTHGHFYGVKSSYTSIYCKGMELEADIVLFGHTHEKFLEEYKGIIFMNPGSVSMPRFKGRYVGFMQLEEGKNPEIYFREIK